MVHRKIEGGIYCEACTVHSTLWYTVQWEWLILGSLYHLVINSMVKQSQVFINIIPTLFEGFISAVRKQISAYKFLIHRAGLTYDTSCNTLAIIHPIFCSNLGSFLLCFCINPHRLPMVYSGCTLQNTQSNYPHKGAVSSRRPAYTHTQQPTAYTFSSKPHCPSLLPIIPK